MVYQTVVVGGCGGAGAGGDGKDDRNKRPIRKAGGRHNQRARLTCPRCHSTNTKFCYFNNYSLSQPRHFCKGCRRFWTQGGTLRNVPVGGNHRQRGKRAREESEAVSATTTSAFTNHHHSAVSLPPQPLTLPTQTVVVPQLPVVFFDNGIVLGDLLNVDNGVLAPPPPPPPQPEMDNNHDTYVEDNNGEHYIFEWGNYMGTSGFNA